MSSIVDLAADGKEVQGINGDTVRQAYNLLVESGLDKDTLRSINYELDTIRCSVCERSWLKKVAPCHHIPPWRVSSRLKKNELPKVKGRPNKSVRSAISEALDGKWEAYSCPKCILTVADRIAQQVAHGVKQCGNCQGKGTIAHSTRYGENETSLTCRVCKGTGKRKAFTKKMLNNLLRSMRFAVEYYKEKDETWKWKNERRFDGYVAITNALMQNLDLSKGNKRASLLLIDIASYLGII